VTNPAFEPYLPTGQGLQSVEEVNAVISLYVPSGHALVQSGKINPVVLPYLPVGQGKQPSVLGPVNKTRSFELAGR